MQFGEQPAAQSDDAPGQHDDEKSLPPRGGGGLLGPDACNRRAGERNGEYADEEWQAGKEPGKERDGTEHFDGTRGPVAGKGGVLRRLHQCGTEREYQQ